MSLSQTLGAIAEPTRLLILDAVRDRERSVNELVAVSGMDQPGVSRHLKVLRTAGLVDVRPAGQHRYYRARFEPLQELDAWLEFHRLAWDERLDRLETHLDRATPHSRKDRS